VGRAGQLLAEGVEPVARAQSPARERRSSYGVLQVQSEAARVVEDHLRSDRYPDLTAQQQDILRSPDIECVKTLIEHRLRTRPQPSRGRFGRAGEASPNRNRPKTLSLDPPMNHWSRWPRIRGKCLPAWENGDVRSRITQN